MYAVKLVTNCLPIPSTLQITVKRGIDIADEASLTTVFSIEMETSMLSPVAMYFAMNSLHRLS